MTTKTDSIWAAAEHLLRRDAEELRESSTSSRDRDDWTGEEEAKADYDEHIAAADALSSLSTAEPVPTGEYPPLPVRYAYDDEGNELFSTAQVFNFVDADRAMRAQAAPAAVAGPVVAWRVVVRGVNSSAQRHWIDGAPSDEMLADFALNAPQASIQYAYAAPTTQAAPAAQGDALDAERYRLLRRGQRWSVIDGIGDTLRGDELDAAIDAARAAKEGGA